MTQKEITILGSEWIISQMTIEENQAFDDCDGYCDPSVRKIYFRKYTEACGSHDYQKRALMQKKTLRHEIIHAFLYESGLWRNTSDIERWSMNEEMIDWIAIQFPKLQKAFKEAEAI